MRLFTHSSCRRAQWAPVRIEVELRKLQAQRPELGRLVPLAASSAGAGLVKIGSGGSHKGSGSGGHHGGPGGGGGGGDRQLHSGGGNVRPHLNSEGGVWEQHHARPATP